MITITGTFEIQAADAARSFTALAAMAAASVADPGCITYDDSARCRLHCRARHVPFPIERLLALRRVEALESRMTLGRARSVS